jgi:hypothetical protein
MRHGKEQQLQAGLIVVKNLFHKYSPADADGYRPLFLAKLNITGYSVPAHKCVCFVSVLPCSVRIKIFSANRIQF